MKKILIVEDDKVVSNIYRNKFEQAGYEVATALDGEEGLQMLAKFKPDLVQLDLMLPKVNGVEIIKHIRAQPEFKSLPIIVLSNNYVSELTREAWRAGANKCVAKTNCSPNVVLEILEKLLNAPVAPPREPTAAAGAPAVPGVSPAADTTETILASMKFAAGKAPADIYGDLQKRAPQIQTDVRDRMHALIKSSDPAAQLTLLLDLYRSIHFLAGYSGIAGFSGIAHVAGALEALLKELHQRPKQITPSTLRTVAQAVDCVNLLFDEASLLDDSFLRSILIVAVDDEPMARQALSSALGKANLPALSLDSPELALKVLEQNRIDLLFLDVEMPGMDGFELCRRVRALPLHRTTPVVFVTTQSNFQARAQSVLSGGTELIAKPFLLLELAVKALTILFKAQTSHSAAAPAAEGPLAP